MPGAESYPRERERTLDIGVSPVVGRHHDGEELEVDEGDVGGRQPRGDLFRVCRADQRLANPQVKGWHRGCLSAK